MKKLLIAPALLLALILFFAGCAGQTVKPETPRQSYVTLSAQFEAATITATRMLRADMFTMDQATQVNDLIMQIDEALDTVEALLLLDDADPGEVAAKRRLASTLLWELGRILTEVDNG